MGSINPVNIGAANLASSFAGAQKNQSTDQAKEAASEKTFKEDLKTIAAQASGDVTDPNMEPDRDVDGRLFSDEPEEETNTESQEEMNEEPKHSTNAPDALNERGNQLDFEA